MTDQMFVFLCKDVRKHAFEYRRGGLQPVEGRKLEHHVENCEACRDYLDKLEGMLDAAAVLDYAVSDADALFGRIVAEVRSPQDEQDTERDILFERITAELSREASQASEAEADAHEEGTTDGVEPGESDDAEVIEFPRSRMPVVLYVAAALAAGVLLGISIPRLHAPDPAPTTAAPIAEIAPAPSPDVTPTPPPTPIVDLAALTAQPTPANVADVSVYGTAEAAWDVKLQGVRRKVDLREGTLLVEFVPEDGSELELTTDDYTVRVTGTIFYASASDDIVGVVEGSVDVETEGGDVFSVRAGQQWQRGEGVRKAGPDVRKDAELHVDVDAHADKLRAAKPVATARKTSKKPKVSQEVAQTPRAELRAAAEKALRGGRYATAAEYYERMVHELSAREPENASLRLDLARIYIKHLGDEPRARGHLERFVEDRPNDPLTPMARKELCRIAKDDPQCAP